MDRIQITRMARRIATRKLHLGAVIPEGKTFENEHIRVHRYRSAIRVWDLTNAGMRGRQVPVMVLYDLDYLRDPVAVKAVDMLSSKLRRMNYQQALDAAKDFSTRFPGAKIGVSQEKAIRVDPAGTKPIEIRGQHIAVRIEPQEFWVRDLEDPNNEPTLIPGRRKGTTKRLYVWALQNKRQIKSLTFGQMIDLLRELGVDYHQYLAMD